MKLKSIFLSLTLCFSIDSFARDWQLQKNVTNHDVHNGVFCVASTTKAEKIQGRRTTTISGLRIEVISKIENATMTQEPFIQVVIEQDSEFSKAQQIIIEDRSNKYTLDRIFIDGNEKSVFLGKLDERQNLISSIKRLSKLKLNLLDFKSEIGEVYFSLRGSSNAVNTQFSDCNLNYKKPESI